MDGFENPMEDIGHHRIKNRFVGLFSVYAQDRSDYLFETLWSILRGQTRELDRCIGVIEGQISNGLEAVVSEFSEVHWIRIPRVKNYMSFGLPTALNRGVAECHAGALNTLFCDSIAEGCPAKPYNNLAVVTPTLPIVETNKT